MKISSIQELTGTIKDNTLVWLQQVYAEAIQEEINHTWLKDIRKILPDKTQEVVKVMMDLVLREQACLLIALDHDSPRGYFLGMIKECLAEQPEAVGYINGIYVVPSLRQSGIGQELLEAGTQWFKSKGLTIVELYTPLKNQLGLKFWERNGYKPSEIVLNKVLTT